MIPKVKYEFNIPPEVPHTPVRLDLLQSFKILSDLGIQDVGHNLGVFAILDVFLSVEEPVRDLVLTGIAHNGDHLLDLEAYIIEFYTYKHAKFIYRTSSSESSPALFVTSTLAFLQTTWA